jgi:hypothetical protein
MIGAWNFRLALPILAMLIASPSLSHSTGDDTPLFEQAPKVELKDYFRDGKIPKYIQVNLDGYHVRTSIDFDINRTDNIDFRTTKGVVYAVRNVIPMRKGVAVNVVIDGQDRYIYVPGWKKEGFRFCESEACFSSLAEFLKILQDNNISGEELQTCGITIGADGNPMGPGFEGATVPDLVGKVVEDENGKIIPIPQPKPRRDEADGDPATKPRKDAEMADLEEEIAPRSTFKVKPFWESTNPPSASVGRRWSQQLLKSIDTYGKDLLEQKHLGDKHKWCPNYSRLNKADRREFWAHLMVAIAERESNFKPRVTFNESTKRNDYSGSIRPNRHSQGLFQLSYSSAGQKSYRKFCKFSWGTDRDKDLSDRSLTIYDPVKQMNCAVGIMNHWVRKDDGVGYTNGSNWRGGARFWSTLRSSNPATRKVQQRLKRFTPCFR